MLAPIIKTKRLKLRELKAVDHESMVYLLKPEIKLFATDFMPKTVDDIAPYILKIIKSGFISWVILKDDILIGDISIEPELDDKIGEMSWYLDPSYRYNGYGIESCKAVVDYMFTHTNYIRLTAQIDMKNTSSLSLAKKLGFINSLILPSKDRHGNDIDIGFFTLSKKPL